MCKRSLRLVQNRNAAVTKSEPVDKAEKWALALVAAEIAQFSVSMEDAIRRVARRARVTPTLIWSFHYRKPKDVWASAYVRLKEAYERERARQLGRFEDELRKAEIAGVNPAVVRAIAGVAGVDPAFLETEDDQQED